MEDFIIIANKKIPTLLALSFEEQTKGLMFQEMPFPIMSFVYKSPKQNKFWMKNVKHALDIVFVNQGKIINICKGEPNSTTIIGDDQYSDLVVEFPYGYCKAMDLKIGMPIKISYSINSLLKLSSIHY